MNSLKRLAWAVAIIIVSAVLATLMYFLLEKRDERNEIDNWIQDMNISGDPCKDFYQYTCGGYLAKNPTEDNAQSRLQDAIDAEKLGIKKIVLSNPEKSDIKPIIEMKQFLKSCLDSEVNEEKEIKVLKRLVNKIGGWQLLDPESFKSFDWIEAVAEIEVSRSTGNSAIISVDVITRTENDQTKSFIEVKKPSFGLPIKVLANPFSNGREIGAYENFIFSVAKEMGSVQGKGELRKAVEDIVDFEISLAKIAEMSKTEVAVRLDELSGEKGFISKFIELVTRPFGVAIERIWVEGEYFDVVRDFLKGENNLTIANYVAWTFISGLIEATPSFYKMKDKFDKDLGKSLKAEDRESVCVRWATASFRRALVWKYMENGGRESKREMELMAGMILNVTKKSLKEECKDEMFLAKLEGIRLISFEDKERVEKYYEKLELGESYVENQVRISRFRFEKELIGKLQEDPNGENLYKAGDRYSRFNTIHITGALLQPPFFHGSRPKYLNYGGLGSTIAHEIGHAVYVSPPGKNDGYFSWKAFSEKIKCFPNEVRMFWGAMDMNFGNYEVTFKEDFADLYGLIMSWRAYQDYVGKYGEEKGLLEPGLDKFTAEQLFFLSYANGYCDSHTPENNQVIRGHSPAKFRVNWPLRHSKEFAKAFNCSEGADGINPSAENLLNWFAR